ncbi:MAG TPA: dTMP kinase [candidate division Zixibacteria bacterium]|nr:dTMP kinase [candidate division Zixibacteria bacterium]
MDGKTKDTPKRPTGGLFITFEGIDGSGKSTQARLAGSYLKKRKLPVVIVREPGSAPLSERIRRLLLNKDLHIEPYPELLLYLAARGQLVRERIIPALEENTIIVCDRFHDSTVAYQGYGRGLDRELIERLRRQMVGSVTPDLTLVYDVDYETSLSRRKKSPDRLENESEKFFKRTRAGFRAIARQEPNRVRLIDARKDEETVWRKTQQALDELLVNRKQ